MTANDLWKAIKSYWEGKRIEFLTEKTKEMKQVLPTVEVYFAKQDTTIRNAGDTSDRHPCCEIGAWHKYWQIATVNYDNMMYCSSCGKPIFSDITDDRCQNVSQGKDEEWNPDRPENHLAHGGHIIIDVLDPNGYFITPLCPHCNGQHEAELPLKKDSLVVKEEKAVVVARK